MSFPRLSIADPGLSALKSAARAAIIMPAVFAVAYELIRQPQTATFAAFAISCVIILASRKKCKSIS